MDEILQQTEQCLAVIENELERKHLTGHLDAIRAYIAWVRGEADVALGYTGAALENLPEDDWMTRSHVLNTEGLAYQYQFELVRAKSAFEAAILAGEKTGRFYESFYAYTNLAFSYFLQGRLHQAFNNCQHVLSIAEKSGQVSIHMPVLAYAHATLSEVQHEWNDLSLP